MGEVLVEGEGVERALFYSACSCPSAVAPAVSGGDRCLRDSRWFWLVMHQPPLNRKEKLGLRSIVKFDAWRALARRRVGGGGSPVFPCLPRPSSRARLPSCAPSSALPLDSCSL